MLALDPGWVDTVVSPFRSAASSIERRYRSLDGDPVGLERTASEWSADADRLDASWERFDATRETAEARWTGRGADGFQERARTWVAEVATTAQSLRFAADGLRIAAAEMSDAQRRADGYVRWYVQSVNLLWRDLRSRPVVHQRMVLGATVSRIHAVGWSTLQAVQARAQALDHVLASMPRRFEVGPGAPWRRGVSRVANEQRSGSWSGMFTIPLEGIPVGLRVSRSEGIVVTRDNDGRIVIGLRDSYGAGPHAGGGKKTTFDQLPEGWQQKLNRAYGEIEASATVGYLQRYRFASVAEAQQFIDRLQGTTPLGRIAAGARDTLGFYAGPLADFGPLHDRITGRPPDETVVSVGLAAKGSADAGLQPVLADRLSTSGAVSGVYTERADGGSARGYLYERELKAGVTTGYQTALVGGLRTVLHRTDYDARGEATQYVRQISTVGDYEYHAGTNGSYVGVRNLPGGVAGGHLKADFESATRRVETTSLDLRDAENRGAYEAAGTGAPGSTADDGLRDRLDADGVVTVREYRVDRQVGEGSGRFLGFGAKAGPQFEEQRLVDSWYTDPSGDRRPIPQDPRMPGGGIIDVDELSTPAG